MAATYNSETLEIIVLLKDHLNKAVKKINQGLKDVRNKAMTAGKALSWMGGKVKGLGNMIFSLKGALVGLGVGLLVRSFVKAASTADGFRGRLKILLGSVKEGNRLFKEMSDFAGTVSYEYENVMDSATTLSGVMKGGVDQVKKWMPLIADLAAASGIGLKETTGQVVKMFSAGASAADMFRERGILAMLGFKAGVKVSAQETQKILMEAWEGPTSKIRGAAKSLAKTWTGMLSMMADAWFQFRLNVMDRGVMDYMESVLSLILDQIEKMKKSGALDDLAKTISSKIISGFKGILVIGAVILDMFHSWHIALTYLETPLISIMKWINRILSTMIKGLSMFTDALLNPAEKLVDVLEKSSRSNWSIIPADAIEKVKELGKAWVSLTDDLQDKIVKKIFPDGTADDINAITGAIKSFKGELPAGLKELSVYLEENAQMIEETQANLAENARLHLEELNKQGSAYDRIKKLLLEIDKMVEDRQKGPEEKEKPIIKKPPPVPTWKAGLESELANFLVTNKTFLTTMEDLYIAHGMGLEEWFMHRRDILEKNAKKEIEILKELRTDPELTADQRLEIDDKVFSVEQTLTQNLITLNREKIKTEDDYRSSKLETQKLLDDIKSRSEISKMTGFTAEFQKESADLQSRQRDENELLNQALKEGLLEKDQIEEAHRQHQIERDQLAADQRKRIQENLVENMKTVLSGLGSDLATLYESSGKSMKAFAKAGQLVSIAQAIISTYEGAQEAYKAMAGIKIVGPALGAAAAGVAIGAGLARVAAIRAQKFFYGGLVNFKESSFSTIKEYISGGSVSGRKGKDKIPALLTDKEFVQPVSAVEKYGVSFQEAIRARVFSKEAIQNLMTTVKAPFQSISIPKFAYAEGGQAISSTSSSSNVGMSVDIGGIKIYGSTNPGRLAKILPGEIEETVIRVMQEQME